MKRRGGARVLAPAGDGKPADCLDVTGSKKLALLQSLGGVGIGTDN
jgi:hypothetical protein